MIKTVNAPTTKEIILDSLFVDFRTAFCMTFLLLVFLGEDFFAIFA